jgi:hypothetical protein
MPALIRSNARVALPSDVAGHLARFGLTLADVLTDSNPKLGKGAAIARAVIHHGLPGRALAAAIDPANQAAVAPRGHLAALAALAEREGMAATARAFNACPWATEGCSSACLAWAGHGGLSPAVAAARGRRTLAMLADPALYGRAILWAIARQWAKAQAEGLPLAVRLRGTDDQPWHVRRLTVSLPEAIAIRRRFGLLISNGEGRTLADLLAPATADGSVRLYEYSKAPVDGPLGLAAQHAAGWDITASLAGDRATAAADAMAAVRAGFRLAVPVDLPKGAPIPGRVLISHGGQTLVLPTIDGDLTDHRWQDPAAVAVILRGKRSRGADPNLAGFILPDAPLIRLADGTIQLMPA